MATENIMMDAVMKGGNRQELHEKIRQHSIAAGKVIKEEGGENDLVDRIAADPDFMTTKEEIEALPNGTELLGIYQVSAFLDRCIKPVLEKNKDVLGEKAELSV